MQLIYIWGIQYEYLLTFLSLKLCDVKHFVSFEIISDIENDFFIILVR